MTVRSVPIFLQAGSHPAEETRLMLGGMLGTATGSFAGGVASSDPAHGVVRATDFAVTQNGTPNMSVNVAAGGAFIRGTLNANQGAYHVWNDGTVNLSITAADATNGRRDLVIAQVRDAAYSGATNDARITVVTGTAAASPVDPSLASFPNALVLARITVAAGDTAINTADITDLRTLANQSGKMPTFTTQALATIAIPSPVDGQAFYLGSNTATEGPLYHNGSAFRLPWNMPWGYVTHGILAADTSNTSGLNWAAVFTWNGTGLVANRRYLIKASVALEPSALGQGNLEVGSGIGSGTEGRAQWYANGTSWINTMTTAGVFTTTAGTMTRYVSMRMSTGTGGIRALIGSTFQIQDIGPAGAPA
jgi:hypothetical protein